MMRLSMPPICTVVIAITLFSHAGIAQNNIPLTPKQSDKCLSDLNCSDFRDAAYSAARILHVAIISNAYKQANKEQRADIIIGIEWADANHSRPQFEPLIRSFLEISNKEDPYADGRWNALQYLAKRCDQPALHELTLGGASKDSESLMQFSISSVEWADTLASFGKCKYAPARDVLTYSLNAASLNASGAAYESLQKMYSGLCKHAQSPEQAEACYLTHWSKQEKSQNLPSTTTTTK